LLFYEELHQHLLISFTITQFLSIISH
jgi:hypothetical protein